MRYRIIQLFVAGVLTLSPVHLAAQADQSKVLLPPEIGYKNLRTALSFARAHFKKKEFDKAFELFKKCSQVKHLNDLHRAECLWYAAWSAEKAGDIEKAKLYYQKTLEVKGAKFTSNARKSLAAFRKVKNLLPDSSFEKNSSGAWNRMIDQEYLPDTTWIRDDSAAYQGKYSLRSPGKKPLTLMTEGFCAPGAFSCYMKSKSPKGKVRLEVFSYARFVPQRLAAKEYALTDSWQRLQLKIPSKYLKFEKGTAPLFCRITPLTAEPVFVDCLQLEEGNITPWRDFTPNTYTLAEMQKMAVPAVSLPECKITSKDASKPLPGVWEISVSYPVKASKVPVEAALPLPQGKWFGAGAVTVTCESGKTFPAQIRIPGRWHRDGSCRSVLVSFEADLKKGINRFSVKGAEAEKTKPAVTVPLKFTLTAEDAAGEKYVSTATLEQKEFTGSQYTCWLIRGVLTKGDRAFAPWEVRQKIWHNSGVVEISALIRNPGASMLVLKNAALHFDSGKSGKKALYNQYFSCAKESFTHPADGKWGSVQSSGGTLLMREASLRHPVKLEVSEKGRFTAHLWPDGLKSLILSRRTLLHREFVYAPGNDSKLLESLGYRSVAMAKAEYFSQAGFFVFPTGTWRKDQPFFKKSMGDYAYFFSGEAQRIFNYKGRILHGLFNYGDVYGDGGWGNLESYLDFSELIYSASMNDHAAFGWALNRSRHYRDSDIAGGVCCYHSSNHAGGFGYDFSHSWPQGVLYHYLLTGDLRSRDTIREVIANYMNRPVNDPHIQGSRSLGRYLLGLADFYAFTGDPAIKKRFSDQIRYTEKNELKPGRKDQTLFRWHGRLDPFHAWYGCCAMMEMYLLTGDKSLLPSFRREIRNTLNMDFYRNDLNEMWPGAPLQETLPIHAGLLSCHRGALFYPLMKFCTDLTGDPQYLRLGRLSAYAAFLPGIPKAWPMDAMRLAVLDGSSESALLKEVFALQRKAAAREVLNGDFSKNPDWFTHWHLPAGRQMSYDDAVKSWPLREKKEFPKLIQEYREREELVSPWRGYSRNFGWMDHKIFGEKAPSLRVTVSSQWAMGRSTSLACAPIFAEPGTYRFTGRIRFDEGIDKSTNIFFYLVPEGEKRARAQFPLDKIGSFKVDTYTPQDFLTGLRGTVKSWNKPGWKEFEFVFTTAKPCILDPKFNIKLNSKFTQAHAHVDDVKFERIKK